MSEVFETRYKDVFAVGVRSGELTAKFLPLCGGRFASLVDEKTGTELLCQDPAEHYLPEHEESDYCSCNVSAFDDMFPTIDPSAPADGCRKGVVYDDHGEVCRHPHEYKIEDNKLCMRYVSDKLHYTWTKTVSAENGKIVIKYDIKNDSGDAFPYIWAGHCMLSAFVGAKVITPYADDAPVEIMFDNAAEYGKRGDIIKCSPDMITSKSYTAEDNNAYKFYYTEKLPSGKIGYFIPQTGRTVNIELDDKVKYLGVWMNNGNFKDLYCAALEPCTAGYDFVENAYKHGECTVIPPHGSVEFTVKFSVE